MDLHEILTEATRHVAGFHDSLRSRRITPKVSAPEIRRHLEHRYGPLSEGTACDTLLADVSEMMASWNVQVTHPRYFGLFNPTVLPAAVAADLLVAGFNPQLAAWSHAPAANEIEGFTLRCLAGSLGMSPDRLAATFTTGGAEANQSALLVALTHAFPAYPEEGCVGLGASPVLYVTSQSHHSVVKAARLSGLGRRAVRLVDTDGDLRMDVEALRRDLERDRAAGLAPFLVVGTAGTTAAGVVDPLAELATLCRDQDLWFHVDAAWGGAACLSPRLAPVLAGIERADSVTWDAHKWLSVPMGAGMLFCAHPDPVTATFGVATSYMPRDVEGTADPYAVTAQWSRRHIGLKVFMALAAVGLEGYRRLVEHQAAMGDRLREELLARGWTLSNHSPLPVVCFTREEIESGRLAAETVAARVQDENHWISTVRLGGPAAVLRACITSYETTLDDVVALADAVTRAAEGGAEVRLTTD